MDEALKGLRDHLEKLKKKRAEADELHRIAREINDPKEIKLWESEIMRIDRDIASVMPFLPAC